MKTCPKCQTQHSNKGAYCTRKCANSRIFTEEAKRKKSAANQKFWKTLSDEDKIKKTSLLIAYCPTQPDTYLQTLVTQDWNILGLHSRRLRVILEQDGKCNRCKLSHWLNEPITLEYEHKDGNKHNNERNNVEALCPNCHSMTKTWRGRKNKGRQKRIEQYIEMNKVPRQA